MAPDIRHSLVSVRAGWFSPEDCDLDEFVALVQDSTDLDHYPFAEDAQANVLIYGPDLTDRVADGVGR